MSLRWLLEGTISFDIATIFLPVRAISKCTLSPCGPCRMILYDWKISGKLSNIWANDYKIARNFVNIWDRWD